jgi:hypothetical protein
MRHNDEGVSDSRGIEPEPGATIVTYDEKRLGVVKAHSAGYIHVGVRWGRDYWLSCDLIRRHEPGQVILNISKSVLGGYKQKRPSQISELLSEPRPMRPPAGRTEGGTRQPSGRGLVPSHPGTSPINAAGGTALAPSTPQIANKE